MLYRYLAVDGAGAFPLLSYQQLEPLVGDDVRLILLEATEDWPGALRAHQELEARLRQSDPQGVPLKTLSGNKRKQQPVRRARARAHDGAGGA